MKKSILIFAMVSLLCFVSGCKNEKDGLISCELKQNDVVSGFQTESIYDIKYTGQYVDYIMIEQKLIFENESLIELYKKTLNDSYQTLNDNYGGYTIDINSEGKELILKVKMDFANMNVEQYAKDQPIYQNYLKNNKFTKIGIQKIYESLGATCTKN